MSSRKCPGLALHVRYSILNRDVVGPARVGSSMVGASSIPHHLQFVSQFPEVLDSESIIFERRAFADCHH